MHNLQLLAVGGFKMYISEYFTIVGLISISTGLSFSLGRVFWVGAIAADCYEHYRVHPDAHL